MIRLRLALELRETLAALSAACIKRLEVAPHKDLALLISVSALSITLRELVAPALVETSTAPVV
jgi:hypothetical protein